MQVPILVASCYFGAPPYSLSLCRSNSSLQYEGCTGDISSYDTQGKWVSNEDSGTLMCKGVTSVNTQEVGPCACPPECTQGCTEFSAAKEKATAAPEKKPVKKQGTPPAP